MVDRTFTFTSGECKVLAKLLELASDEFSNNGCNDFNVAKFTTEDDRKKLVDRCEYTDDSDEEYRNRLVESGLFQDWVLMQAFAREFK